MIVNSHLRNRNQIKKNENIEKGTEINKKRI